MALVNNSQDKVCSEINHLELSQHKALLYLEVDFLPNLHNNNHHRFLVMLNLLPKGNSYLEVRLHQLVSVYKNRVLYLVPLL